MRTYLEIATDLLAESDGGEPCEWFVIRRTGGQIQFVYEYLMGGRAVRLVLSVVSLDVRHDSVYLDHVIRALQEIKRDLDAEAAT